mmetsp:Transcript_16254/g.29356  ORF Transcript_16254/g.29356 Transcript_16254/m.29356 type:complete len:541 (+) Transcript_16254:338-1960(+)
MKNYQSIQTEEVPPSEPVFAATQINSSNSNNNNNIKNAHPQDHLAPPFDSPERPSNLFVGTFNLIATIVGGGVLSLPIVFEKCGIAFTTLGMILSAAMTYATLVMLCYCGRRGGGSSYGEVVRSAFGTRMEEGVSWLLFVFLWFVIVAYMILIRDIWTPLVRQVGGWSDADGNYVLLGITVILLPLLFQRSLHALRYNCYIGSASIFVLCIALCRGGWQNLHNNDDHDDDDNDGDYYDNISDIIEEEDNDFTIDYFKMPSLQDALFSFPILSLCFLCHFNIISIQNALHEPTRQRIQNLTKYAILASFLLMYSFGLGGYLYARSSTEGNILLNVPTVREPGEDEAEYYLFLLGRIGCGTTIVFAWPLMLLPCRESLLEVVDVWFHHTHPRDSTTEDEIFEVPAEGSPFEEDDANNDDNVCSPHIKPSVLLRHDPIQSDYIFRNALLHYGSTMFVIITCYLAAVAVTGVAVVWSFAGSSMAFFIAFILPCGCFVVIESAVPTAEEGGDRKGGWIWLARGMFCLSAVGAVVCTVNNTMSLWR